MKVTSTHCKDLIVAEVARIETQLSNDFEPPESMEAAKLVKNWKREYKERSGDMIERLFDCRPYDDQLRGYVRTNATDDTVLEVEVVAE